MSLLQDVRSISRDLETPDLIAYLIKDRFAGKVVVTASSMASSVVVLKMVADIDPSTPVVFCLAGVQFPESMTYRERIVDLLGLSNVTFCEGREIDVEAGDQDHSERMWVETENLPGRTFEIVHLNKTLKPYDCWISAVYHVRRDPAVKKRIDIEGRLIRVDPLLRWTRDDVRAFMRAYRLPYHDRARRKRPEFVPEEISEAPGWHF